MARPKVFFEATPLINAHLSGVGHVVLETLRALDSDEFTGYDLRAFVPWDEYDKLKAYGFTHIRPVRLPYPHKVFSLFARLPWAPPLDLFLGRGSYVFFNFRNLTLAGSKSLTYVHDACYARHPEFVQPRNLAFLKRYMPLWLRRANRIVAVSDFSRHELHDALSVDPERTVTIRNTVDVVRYHVPDLDTVAAVRTAYGLDKPYLLFVGNVEPRKNLLTLVRAFADSPRAKDATLFIVGGDGWLNEAVTEAITASKAMGYDIRRNETFVPDDDVAALMAGARALVMPSWYEGFGLPALEALCTGTPVIVSDTPGLREAVAGHETDVSFFAPDDQASLTRIIDGTIATEKPVLEPVAVRPWSQVVRELLAVIEETRRKI